VLKVTRIKGYAAACLLAVSSLLPACAAAPDASTVQQIIPTLSDVNAEQEPETVPEGNLSADTPVAEPTAQGDLVVTGEVQGEPGASTDAVIEMFNEPATAQGDLLILYGRVLDVHGQPLADAVIEIWQTDANGIYDHPDDSQTGNRDMGFQFYGHSVTDMNGMYMFRTIMPGEYEPRPRHIHVKVRLNGGELLTTQFYFDEDGAAGGVGGSAQNLLLTLEQDVDGSGSAISIASFDLVVDTGAGQGPMPLTDSQSEGPYYPLEQVASYDNDLASVDQ
jgi:protocatechuate 3,4-dioxygenase beta subunit